MFDTWFLGRLSRFAYKNIFYHLYFGKGKGEMLGEGGAGKVGDLLLCSFDSYRCVSS